MSESHLVAAHEQVHQRRRQEQRVGHGDPVEGKVQTPQLVHLGDQLGGLGQPVPAQVELFQLQRERTPGLDLVLAQVEPFEERHADEAFGDVGEFVAREVEDLLGQRGSPCSCGST